MAATTPTMSLNLLLRQAVEHHRSGKLDQADDIYAFICNTDNKNTQVFYLRGLIAQDKGAYAKAIELFETGIKNGASHADIYIQLGRTYNLSGNPESALAHYQTALSIDPTNVDALCNAANVMGQLGRQQEALSNYQAALKLSPGTAAIHYNLGTLYLQRLQPEKACPCFESAIKLRPDYATAWNSLGAALNEMGELDQAMLHYRKAHEIDGSFPEPLFNLHGIHLDRNEIQESLRCLMAAADIAPNNITYRFFLGALHQCSGNTAEGERILGTLRGKAQVKAEIDSWDYLRSINPTLPPMIGSGVKIITLAMEKAKLDGLILEFGVFNGKSIRLIASLTDRTVHGFDSFEGLPEAWGDEGKGSYNAFGQLPEVPDNVRLHRGWFENSIPEFLKSENGPIRFINIDCDLYSSTKTIFDLLGPLIMAGTVILFDEFIGYPTWQDDEFKAFHEAAERFGWRYDILGFSFLTKQLALIIKP